MARTPLTWLITGCSSGFGLALIKLAEKQGHTIIATSHKPQKTPDLLPLDVNDLNSGDLIMDLEKANTLIDILSIYSPIDTVFFRPYRLIRRNSGIIVNISSGARLEGRESIGVYIATKAIIDRINKVLVKEMAPFSICVLIVTLGSFNINIGLTVRLASKPMLSDYDDIIFKVIATSVIEGFPADRDHVKVAKVKYKVVTGIGVGEGKESERMLPLGRDMAKRVDDVVGGWQRTMEVFGDVCNNVYLEK
ncbi:uncharacterized protein BDZ83DRAFT_723991 [Colletotrichum acutatum]|uniref:Uncharacterized protein n=1 Tax=Glomerella acutata TaxID=27357 RepID=A0AAD8UA52_GLOAC|nr:uncharacterized protein BDZ83DRAFT_723991 [Colletotrichum acutatum]KAK1710594.1 hypothetical protein BDZ83DRAFT_723991 [Colletotrichum acutatum]